MKSFLGCVKDSQKAFHDQMKEEMQSGISPIMLEALERQLEARNKQLKFRGKALLGGNSDLNKEANRHFTPAVQEYIADAYADIQQESGKCSLSSSP